jgi:hypothetical protein
MSSWSLSVVGLQHYSIKLVFCMQPRSYSPKICVLGGIGVGLVCSMGSFIDSQLYIYAQLSNGVPFNGFYMLQMTDVSNVGDSFGI